MNWNEQCALSMPMEHSTLHNKNLTSYDNLERLVDSITYNKKATLGEKLEQTVDSETIDTMARITSDKPSHGVDPENFSMDGIENSSMFDFFDSIMTCRDKIWWSEANDGAVSSPTVGTRQDNSTSTSSFYQIVYSLSSSMSMSNNIVDTQDYYASRWKGHLPLSPLPSNDSLSRRTTSLKRRRTVR